ncbi:MAG: hypothetical protein ACYYK0_07205 [Candidatus Eutrophobiaceae bacterium]
MKSPLLSGVRLDAVVPVFDPGLPEELAEPGSMPEFGQGIWLELRRAEANRFAWSMRRALERTKAFRTVRVMPDRSASGDLYIIGRIAESTGVAVEIEVDVVDAGGRLWLRESFSHEVLNSFHRNIRNDDQDAYAPVFSRAASEIVKILRARPVDELEALPQLAEMRFGLGLAEEAFQDYVRADSDRFELLALPDEEDPMLQRIRTMRVRDQLYVDDMQEEYFSFSQRMEETYLKWQRASAEHQDALSKARKQTWWNFFKGSMFAGIAVLLGLKLADDSSTAQKLIYGAGTVAGGTAAYWLFSDAFETRQKAIDHQEKLNELGESLNLELAAKVVKFEGRQARLNGDIQQQFNQWRQFLKEIFVKEPEVQL